MINPKVSVIMGVYNGAHRLARAVESIINQTFKDFEFIICDDGSTDGSYDVLKKIGQTDDRIILIKNEKNMGLASALNNCLKIAKGEYIARMDDDDYSHSDRFEKQVAFFNAHDEYAILGTSANVFDEIGVVGKNAAAGERSSLDIYKFNSFIHVSVMMRKNALLSVDGYSEEKYAERGQDADLWVRMYHNGYKGYVLDDILLDYYEGKYAYKRRKYKYRIHEYQIRKKARKLLNIPAKYSLYQFKPLIVGLIPGKLMELYHKKKFNKM